MARRPALAPGVRTGPSLRGIPIAGAGTGIETVIAFKHLVCAIDFSETATRALDYAIAIAKWYDAQLTVLHVVPVFEESMESSLPLVKNERRTPYAPLRADVLAEMRRVITQAGAAALNPALLAKEGRTHAVIVGRRRLGSALDQRDRPGLRERCRLPSADER